MSVHCVGSQMKQLHEFATLSRKEHLVGLSLWRKICVIGNSQFGEIAFEKIHKIKFDRHSITHLSSSTHIAVVQYQQHDTDSSDTPYQAFGSLDNDRVVVRICADIFDHKRNFLCSLDGSKIRRRRHCR